MQFTYRNPRRSTDPMQRMPTARSIVVAALGYGVAAAGPTESEPSSAMQAGRIARYVWDDHYQRLSDLLERLAEPLRDAGYKSQVILDSNHLVDRNVAWRAGLGWYGKNSNLLLPGVGSWHVIGSILTEATLEPTGPPVADGCGPCRHCIDECPTAAIVAPGIVDARRCIAWLVQAAGSIPIEFRVAVGDRMYGCDDCQEVCPPNRYSDIRLGATERRVDIDWILNASDHDILERHGRWYIAGRDVDVIRRTALVVLGNTADPSWGLRSVTGLVQRHVEGGRPLLRDHAVWAARRLGLVGSISVDPVDGGAGTDGMNLIALPVCCGPTDDAQCPDPDLHAELHAEVSARFSPADWATGTAS